MFPKLRQWIDLLQGQGLLVLGTLVTLTLFSRPVLDGINFLFANQSLFSCMLY